MALDSVLLAAQGFGGSGLLIAAQGFVLTAPDAQESSGGNSKRRRARMPPLFDLPEFRDENESLTMIMALLTAGAFQ